MAISANATLDDTLNGGSNLASNLASNLSSNTPQNPSSELSCTTAVILIGGPQTGTRFRPLSFKVPKPLFPIGKSPLIHHHISACAKLQQLKTVFLIGNYNSADPQISTFLSRTRIEFSELKIIYLQCVQKCWSDSINLVIFKVFEVKFPAKKSIFQNCLFGHFWPKISLQKPQKRPNFGAGQKNLNALYKNTKHLAPREHYGISVMLSSRQVESILTFLC